MTVAARTLYLVRHGAAGRWKTLAGIANASLTVIELRAAEPPGVVMVNEVSHLPDRLRWTGFAGGSRP